MYNCYIATYGCFIVNVLFNEYKEKSKEAREKYIKNRRNNDINYVFKRLEEFCFNTWKTKLHRH